MNEMQLTNSDRHQQSIMPTCLRTDYILKKKCAISDTPWGPGFEPENKPVDELADYDKVQGLQLEVLKKMIERNHPDEDINYIFLSKCGWDDNYPIDELGEEYTYEDVLLKLVEKYRSEAKFYEEKVDKILEEKQGGNK